MPIAPVTSFRDFEKPQTSTEKTDRIIAIDKEARSKPFPKATKATDIPHSYECITSEWLTAVLGTDVLGARVESHELGEPDEGTSNRRHVYMKWNEAGRHAGLPASVFCKATQKLQNRLIMAFGGLDAEIAVRLMRPLALA
jgi:hypothetical protein